MPTLGSSPTKHRAHSAPGSVRFEAASHFLLPSRQRQTLLTAILYHTILFEARQQSTRFYDSAEGLEFNRLVFQQAAADSAQFSLAAWCRHSPR